jgi:thiol-disulfide isomerase/thioredoxin
LKGSEAGFDAALERHVTTLPFHPEPFHAPPTKAVLAELFTGSECPPCVAADLGFDGLLETYPAKYLAVLEYHLPIPRPDPMMNPTTQKRADFYDIKSTPSVVIDGTKIAPGGGGRQDAEFLYRQYKAEIQPRLEDPPILEITATAILEGDKVKTSCGFSKTKQGIQHYAALVQAEEKFKGGNGIILHKMVVRELSLLPPFADMTKITVTFDLAQLESRTDGHLTEFENTSESFKGFKFPERRHKLDRTKLKVVFFTQDPETKQVFNAFVVDVAPAGQATKN